MNQLLNSHAGNHSDENGPFEVFYQDAKHGRTIPAGQNPTHLGWYWSCPPDNDPQGPFDSSHDAWQAAKDLDMGHGLQDRPCHD